VISNKIFCFWTGDELLSKNRLYGLNCIKLLSGCKVILVDKNNLCDYIIPQFPLHDQYKNLSSTHKSDYLRSYFMYHYGGGYADIKPYGFNWNLYFDLLEKSDKQFIGYPEQSFYDIAGEDNIRMQWKKLVGNGFYIFKPKTEFAKEWFDKTNDVLDYHRENLERFPGTYHPRAIKSGIHDPSYGEVYKSKGYPLEWNEILGRVFHKLQTERIGDFLNEMPPFRTSLVSFNYR